MGLQLFEVDGGFSDGVVHYLNSNGAPGADASYQDAAPIGSYCSDATTGDTYKKIQAGAGAGPNIWQRQATIADLTGLSASQSWREPAQCMDATFTTITAAIASMDATDTVDGITVVAGDRILFTAITGGNGSNVYIVGGSTGAWTLTEDANQETNGDTLQVLAGTHANEIWMFNGTWSWIGATAAGEDNFIRAFIGKSAAGGSMPSYTSNNYVANNDSVTTAIGKLDAQAALNASAIASANQNITAVIAELNVTQAASGLAADGSFVPFVGSNYLDTSINLADALRLADAHLGTLDTNLASEIATRTSTVGALNTTVNTIEASVGLNPDGTFTAPTGTAYLGAITSVMGGLTALDAAIVAGGNATTALDARMLAAEGLIAANQAAITTLQTDLGTTNANLAQELIDRAAADNVLSGHVGDMNFTATTHLTGLTDLSSAVRTLDAAFSQTVGSARINNLSNGVVDRVSTDAHLAAQWLVVVSDTANNAIRESFTVNASHNGTAAADATTSDHSRYGRVKSQGGVAGLRVSTAVPGVGVNQHLELSVSAPSPVDVRVTRLVA